MTRKWSRLLAAAVCASAVFMTVAAHAAPANVVYGNLGANGTGSLAGTNTDYGGGSLSDPVASLAQGFTTGSSTDYLTLKAVTLGLFSNDTPAGRTVSIFSDAGGVPGSVLYTSASQEVTSTGKYTFTFSNPVLSANTNYWIVPSGPASWYLNSPFSSPQGQNSSGWTYLGTKQVLTATPTNWVDADLPNYSVSVQAVPEPSTWALAGIGVAGAALLRWRRRRAAR